MEDLGFRKKSCNCHKIFWMWANTYETFFQSLKDLIPIIQEANLLNQVCGLLDRKNLKNSILFLFLNWLVRWKFYWSHYYTLCQQPQYSNLLL